MLGPGARHLACLLDPFQVAPDSIAAMSIASRVIAPLLHASHRTFVSRLLEGLRRRRAPSLHADVGIVREMLPPGLALGRRGRMAHSLRLCLPSSLTVLAWGPFSPISSANVT